MPNKLLTGLVRFSYCHVWEPHANEEGNEPKYSVSVLVPKKDKKQIKMLEKAVQDAIAEARENGKLPKKGALKLPLRDGDEERPDDPAYEGMMFFNASSKIAPGIVDAQRQDIIDKMDFYSGCWGRMSFVFYPFAVSGNKGIAAGMNNLQKLKDDEPLAGNTSPQDDFNDDFADDFTDDGADETDDLM